ncbi:PAS domain-containing protein [Chondromyces crocatus]|nr:PAS domain-containing protein [Chondromyces crocatus]
MPALRRFLDHATWGPAEFLQRVIDTIPDPIFVKDRQHRWIAVNEAYCGLHGREAEELLGRSDPDYHPAEEATVFWEHDDRVFASGAPDENEEVVTNAEGALRTIWTRKFPLRDEAGEVAGLCGIITDVTRMKERLQEAERLEADHLKQQATIDAQATLIDRMAMPVLQIWEGILLMPVIGEISHLRAALALENLMESVARDQARFLLLDLTGVPIIDTAIAHYIVKAVKAVELLGCACALVGIGPEIAKTLVHLEVDLGRVVTHGTLQSGLAHAQGRLAQQDAGARGAKRGAVGLKR